MALLSRAVMVALAYVGAPKAQLHAARRGCRHVRAFPAKPSPRKRATPDARASRPPAVLRTLYPDGMAPGSPLWVACIVWLVAYHTGEIFERVVRPSSLDEHIAPGVRLR
jgi:hypothetical protein